MLHRTLLLLGILLSTASPASIVEPKGTFAGPLQLCGFTFRLDLAKGEEVQWTAGADFDIYVLTSGKDRLGFYEGNHPDAEGKRQPILLNGIQAQRIMSETGEVSYLVKTQTEPLPTYVHLFGSAHNDQQERLLSRMKIGPETVTGCDERTVEPLWRRFMNGEGK